MAKKAINSRRAIVSLLRELDRLSEGRRVDKLLLIRQSVSNSWKSVFPLRQQRRPADGAIPAHPGGPGGGAHMVAQEEDRLSAQVAVLGSLLIEPRLVGQALERIRPEDFLTPKCRMVFQAIQTLFAEGKPTDAVTVRSRLGGREGDGWTQYLMELMELTPTAVQRLGVRLSSCGSRHGWPKWLSWAVCSR